MTGLHLFGRKLKSEFVAQIITWNPTAYITHSTQLTCFCLIHMFPMILGLFIIYIFYLVICILISFSKSLMKEYIIEIKGEVNEYVSKLPF